MKNMFDVAKTATNKKAFEGMPQWFEKSYVVNNTLRVFINSVPWGKYDTYRIGKNCYINFMPTFIEVKILVKEGYDSRCLVRLPGELSALRKLSESNECFPMSIIKSEPYDYFVEAYLEMKEFLEELQGYTALFDDYETYENKEKRKNYQRIAEFMEIKND